jgi:hypothetical protein
MAWTRFETSLQTASAVRPPSTARRPADIPLLQADHNRRRGTTKCTPSGHAAAVAPNRVMNSRLFNRLLPLARRQHIAGWRAPVRGLLQCEMSSAPSAATGPRWAESPRAGLPESAAASRKAAVGFHCPVSVAEGCGPKFMKFMEGGQSRMT